MLEHRVKGNRIGRGRLMVVIMLTLALGSFGIGCGSSSNSDVTLTVATWGSTEGHVLGQIYAQALEAAGYTVKRNLDFEPMRSADELRGGWISGYPEHLNIAWTELLAINGNAPTDPTEAYEKAKAGFEKQGLTAFPPTPFSLNNAVGVLRKTAAKRGLKTVSDLKGQSGEMELRGEFDCHRHLDCLGGLEDYYGIAFKGFAKIDPALRYKVLEDGQADASMLLTTDGQLLAEKNKFVALEEDKHVFPAGNVIWVTTPKVVEEAGPDYEKAILNAQKGLTLKVMQELDAQVELEGTSAEEVAAEYLKAPG